MDPHSGIHVQGAGAEQLGQLTRRPPAHEIHLEEALLGVQKARGPGHIRPAPAPDHRDTQGIPRHRDIAGKPGQGDFTVQHRQAGAGMAHPPPGEAAAHHQTDGQRRPG
ncbi:hypothetical protein RZS08_35965, partial [Arthrospira platensis SPKY1]|nr:hypothetical protein [Arthrospira platensis SPKY1]